MKMSYRLMTHVNQHGHGVSVIKYGPLGTLVGGFVLNTFDTAPELDKYVKELIEFTGWRMDRE